MPTRLLVLAVALRYAPAAVAGERGLSKYLKDADAVIIAKLDKAAVIHILYSRPPVYLCNLHLTVQEVMVGALKPGTTIDAQESLHQVDPYPVGKSCVVGLEFDAMRKTWKVIILMEALEINVDEAKKFKKGK